jgi:hypothetical protein
MMNQEITNEPKAHAGVSIKFCLSMEEGKVPEGRPYIL